MLGVFTFAGVVTLPYRYLVALVALVYLTVWPTFRRAGAKRHRHAYTGLSVTVGCCASAAVYNGLGRSLIAVPISILTFIVINAGMVAAAIATARHHQAWPMLRSRRLYAVLSSTMTLGAAIGYAINWHPLAGAAGMPVVLAVHLRNARGTVEETGACTDGIWNRAGWLALADEAHRAGDRFSALLVELPDVHEANIACEIVRARFGEEVLGRYGDTQLVVLLRESEGPATRYLALRLTGSLEKAGLRAGVGSADSHASGSVAGMLAAAAGEAIIRRSLDSDSELR